MNLNGILVGFCTFLIIGLFHPLVIKGYYHFGIAMRYWFLIAGIIAGAASFFVDSMVGSILLGVVAFSSFWSIHEINEQKQRVEKGWFPANPRHKK